MSKPHPVEFRRDVVAVARKREAQLRRIAKDFGISSNCFPKRLKRAEVEEGVAPGVMEKDAPALREAKKWIPVLGQEAEVLRRAVADPSQECHQKIYPLVLEPATPDVLLKVPVEVTCRVCDLTMPRVSRRSQIT